MKRKKLPVIRGSGNVFRDLRAPDADLQQLKTLLAASIVRALDESALSVRKANDLTGIAAADFSRIRNADLARFTVDRLMTVLDRLGLEVDVSIVIRRHRARSDLGTTEGNGTLKALRRSPLAGAHLDLRRPNTSGRRTRL